MAEILLARESTEGGASRNVVIKVVRGEFAEEGDFAKMFLDEGRLAMRLSHPNICTVYECGRSAGKFFMAMEYVHGVTLRSVLVQAAKQRKKLPIPVLLKLFSRVAEALDFAHKVSDSRGTPLDIVHRDVSPHNIMVRFDGVVKLLDFGVAKADSTMKADTAAGAIKGKFSYMSPEQCAGAKLDERSDIFSLGVCLFEAITGRRLFHRKAQYDTLKAIVEEQAPPLSAFRDDVPDQLEEIVARALTKDVRLRYQSAATLQHDLERLLTDLREVVSTARIGRLMEVLYADPATRTVELDTDPAIFERFAAAVKVVDPADVATRSLQAAARDPAASRGEGRGRSWLWGAVAALAVGGALLVGMSLGSEGEPGAPPAAGRDEAPRRAAEPPAPVDVHAPAAPPSVGAAGTNGEAAAGGGEEAGADGEEAGTDGEAAGGGGEEAGAGAAGGEEAEAAAPNTARGSGTGRSRRTRRLCGRAGRRRTGRRSGRRGRGRRGGTRIVESAGF